MGKGMVRAVAATVNRVNVVLVRQPDDSKIVVQCRACGITQTCDLPSGVTVLVAWLKKVEKAHSTCVV
jgi:hypothetical protein